MKLSINGNIFKVKIQTSPEETQEGMMFKKFNKTFNGMLFVMKNQEHCFWMKNCIIPLDIIFIDNDVITKIHHNLTQLALIKGINVLGKAPVVCKASAGAID